MFSSRVFNNLSLAQEKYGPIGLIHVDAHTDTYGPLNGFDIWHGNPFRLAVEEGLLDCDKVWQIGLRGSGHSAMDAKWGQERVRTASIYPGSCVVAMTVYFQGFKAVPAFQCWNKSLLPLMKDIREKMGDTPVYISFDIDGLDPSVAPGTGREIHRLN